MYSSGVITCYFLFRNIVKTANGGQWIVFEKAIVITLSLGSWAIAILYLFFMLLVMLKIIDPDKKAKW